MPQPLLALALLLALTTEPGPAPSGAVVPEPPPDAAEEDLPQGSEAELRLWREGREATRRVVESRAESARTRATILAARLRERLEAVRRGGGHEAAEQATRLVRRLEKDWADNVDMHRRPWPVDPIRGCGYPHLTYDSALRLAPGPSRQAEVANATPDLRTCVERANAAAGHMAASNRRLADELKEGEALLARHPARAPGEGEAHERHERGEGDERRGERR